MGDKLFAGFIIAASLSMAGAVYGTAISNTIVVQASIITGLIASGIGWLGFLRQLRSKT